MRSRPGDITHFSTPARLLPALERAGLSRPVAVGGTYMPKNTMLVVGSLNMDQVVHVPRIPLLGETLLSTSSLKLVPGGKGANQAVAMARLGVPVSMAGRVGSDSFGEALLRSLRANNVDTGLVFVDQEESSGVALIYLTPAGDNAIVVAAGANMRVDRTG